MNEVKGLSKVESEIDFNRDVLMRSLIKTSQGLSSVSPMQVVINTMSNIGLKFTKTNLINSLIEVCINLSKDSDDYNILAGRIYQKALVRGLLISADNFDLHSHITKMVTEGYYDKELLVGYDALDWKDLGGAVKRSKSLNRSFDAVAKDVDDFCIIDISTGVALETPEIAKLIIAATVFVREKKPRNTSIMTLYKHLSKGVVIFPLEIMKNLRTSKRHFYSEAILDTEDSINSINATASSVVNLTSESTPVSVNTGRLRAKGASIQGGRMIHAGALPVHKYLHSAMEAFVGVGGMGGSAKFFIPFWHADIMDVITKSKLSGSSDIGYCIQVNKLFYLRAIRGEKIHLFSPEVSDSLYGHFLEGSIEFENEYLRLESDDSVWKSSMPAMDLLTKVVYEFDKGGVFSFQNIDLCNLMGRFDPQKAPISCTSNSLLANIPSRPLRYNLDSEAEIGHLLRASINYDSIVKTDLGLVLRNLLLSLDNIIDLSEVNQMASRRSIVDRRTIGIDVINTPVISDQFSLYDLDKFMNHFQYSLLKASSDLDSGKHNVVRPSLISDSVYLTHDLPLQKHRDSLSKYGGMDEKQIEDWDRVKHKVRSKLNHSTLSCGSDSGYEYLRCKGYSAEVYLMEVAIKQKYLDNNSVFHLKIQPKISGSIALILNAYKMGIRVVNLVKI